MNDIYKRVIPSKHISNVMQKLNVTGRAQAVVELIRLGELKI